MLTIQRRDHYRAGLSVKTDNGLNQYPVVRTELEAVDWEKPFNDHGSTSPDGKLMEARGAAFTADDDVTKKRGIYPYALLCLETKLSRNPWAVSRSR